MRERLYRVVPALLGLAVFVIALEVLRRELRAVSLADARRGYICHSSRSIGRRRSAHGPQLRRPDRIRFHCLCLYPKTAFASKDRDHLVSCICRREQRGIRHAVRCLRSLPLLFAMGCDHRRVVADRLFLLGDVLVGLLALGGLALASSPLPSAHAFPASDARRACWMGARCCSASVSGLTCVGRKPVRLGKYELPLPSTRLAVAQLLVSVVGLDIGGSCLLCSAAAGASFLTVLGAFLAAQLLGLASHVPGGVGVFEGLMVILLKPFLTSGQLLPALVVFRVIYYLLPLSVALIGLVADEIHQRRSELPGQRQSLAACRRS